MNCLKEDQITYQIQCDRQLVIFDSDNLISNQTVIDLSAKKQNQETDITDNEQSNQNLLVIEGETQRIDPRLVQQLNCELKKTHEQIFKLVKSQQPVRKLKPVMKTLESIEKIADSSVNNVLKEGYMEKKTDGLIFKWKRRYFTLTPEKLYFFEDQNKQKVIGCVNIKIIPLRVHDENDEIVLDFCGECQNIILKCQNKKQKQQWKEWIEQVSKFQQKQKKILLKTIKKPLYLQSNTIGERQFLSKAETGDILLFYTRHIGASIQRVLTNSDFDHVAMIVKFRSHEVMVFQSNMESGVALFQWNQFVRYFNLYDKITCRKLISPRKAEFQHNLLKFVRMNLGRKYELNLSKLFTFQSDFNWQTVNQDMNRGYFCSELIAKAYKSAGLLDAVKSSCRYWPVDFSEKNQMKLLKGAHLGMEQTIVLNKHVKRII